MENKKKKTRKKTRWYWIVESTVGGQLQPLHADDGSMTNHLAAFTSKKAAVLFVENKAIENCKPKAYSSAGIIRRFRQFARVWIYNERQYAVWKGPLANMVQALSEATAN